MIKKMIVVSCDVCAAIAPAPETAMGINEAPAGWITSPNNANVHLCPKCARPKITLNPPGMRRVEVEGESGQEIHYVREG